MTIEELLARLGADITEHWTHVIGAPLDDAEYVARGSVTPIPVTERIA